MLSRVLLYLCVSCMFEGLKVYMVWAGICSRAVAHMPETLVLACIANSQRLMPKMRPTAASFGTTCRHRLGHVTQIKSACLQNPEAPTPAISS